MRFLAAGNLHSISSSKQVECQEHVEVNAHCVPLSVSIQLAKVKTNGNDNLFMTMNKVANIFTRMCDVTFALISNLINKRAGAGMASLMHGFQCLLSC